MAANNPPLSPMQVQQINNLTRQAVVSNSVKMKQPIRSVAIDPTNENVLNIPPRYAGLLQGFIVEVSATVTTVGSTTRTVFGSANLLESIQFDDLSGNTRIQVPGWYMAVLNSVRQGFVYGGSYDVTMGIGYGNNFDVNSAPAAVDNTTADIRQIYYVPISYSGTDLRGAIDCAVVNATANLKLTINQNPFAAAGDELKAIYKGAAGSYVGNVQVDIYQVYLDQIPIDPNNGMRLLPQLDLNTVYDLKSTTFSGFTVGQDFGMRYPNMRSFLSTFVVFDNGGDFNVGEDINYWALASANFTNIEKVTPEIAALDARHTLMTDLPKGCYYFESRDTPINTINWGNMERIINAKTVNANAACLVGYESFALVNQIVGATSLGN